MAEGARTAKADEAARSVTAPTVRATQAPRATVDLRIDYKWDQRYTLYFEARNVLSRPIVIATPILPFNHAEYGDPIYEIGVRGSF